MSELEIRDQPRLSPARTLGMTLNGMRHRLSRSIVTLLVITVAIAFMMNTLGESLLKRSVAARTGTRLASLRAAVTWAARLTGPGALEQILTELAASPPGTPRHAEAQAMAGLDNATMASYHATSRLAVAHLEWLAALDYGRRRRLVHDAEGAAAFDRLLDADAMQRFGAQLEMMHSLRLPEGQAGLADLLRSWPEARRITAAIQARRQEGIDQIAARLDGKALTVALQDASGAFGDVIRAAGFHLDAETAAGVAAEARRHTQGERLAATALAGPLRRRLAARLDRLPGEIDVQTLWALLADRGEAGWYLETMGELAVPDQGLDADRLRWLARRWLEERALARAARAGGGGRTFQRRMVWLMVVSMIVCVVGIANAMLMSVAQRFREIATLKCLGALDGFIALSFIMEACLLGVVGGGIGAAIGLVIALGRMFGVFRGVLSASVPYADLAVATCAAVGAGIVLAGVATVLPALKAARLAPMAAMRVE